MGKERGHRKNKPVDNLRLIRNFVIFLSNPFDFFKSFCEKYVSKLRYSKELFTVAFFPIWLKKCSFLFIYVCKSIV